MSIKHFLEKWNDDPKDDNFIRDFWSVIDNLGDDRFRQVAIEVLSNIKGTELVQTITENPYYNGVIAFGPKGKSLELGIVIEYSPAVGQQGSDWYYLLQTIIESKLNG